MITTKVFHVKNDTETSCHCGHDVEVGEKYFIVRTSIPKWVSLCASCVHMLRQPVEVDMEKLREMWVWEKKKPNSFSIEIGRLRTKKLEDAKRGRDRNRKEKERQVISGADWV